MPRSHRLQRVQGDPNPLGIDSLTLRWWLAKKLAKEGLWNGAKRTRDPSRRQGFYARYTDPDAPRIPSTAPPALPVPSCRIYDRIERSHSLPPAMGERYVPERQRWDEDYGEWIEERAHMRAVKAQPIVGDKYGCRAFVFCNRELHRVLSRRDRIRRVPGGYLIHLPGTPVSLPGEPVITADW